MVAYLKRTGTGITIEQLVARIASPDVKGTYEGLVLPRKLPAPNGGTVDAKRCTTPRSRPAGRR
jgi:mandelamide amidase